jgi:replication factor C subunit 3/5
LKSEIKEYRINPNSTTKVSISILTSTYHLDISPQDAENYDKVILQKLIKEVASTKNLDSK